MSAEADPSSDSRALPASTGTGPGRGRGPRGSGTALPRASTRGLPFRGKSESGRSRPARIAARDSLMSPREPERAAISTRWPRPAEHRPAPPKDERPAGRRASRQADAGGGSGLGLLRLLGGLDLLGRGNRGLALRVLGDELLGLLARLAVGPLAVRRLHQVAG